MPDDIEWNSIAEAYKKSAYILAERTEETRSGCVNGLGHSTEHLNQQRRVELIRLRAATEFLLKSLFTERGFCIFKTSNDLLTIEDVNQPTSHNINLDRTHGLGFLIDKLSSLNLPNSINMSEIQSTLREIKNRGDQAVHGQDFDASVIENARNALDSIFSLIGL